LNFLASSPVDGIGVDMYSYKTDDIKGLVNSGKELALGIINGFNTKIENEDHIINVIRSLNFNGPLYITNNVDFEFLPQKFALKKVDLISKIAGEIS
jgi:Cobalamin-independent synthase, N-terminal domain.